MLTPVKAPKRSIDSYKKEDGLAFFYSEFGTTRIGFYEGNSVRVSFTEGREYLLRHLISERSVLDIYV